LLSHHPFLLDAAFILLTPSVLAFVLWRWAEDDIPDNAEREDSPRPEPVADLTPIPEPGELITAA
jgi:hypothetical protein